MLKNKEKKENDFFSKVYLLNNIVTKNIRHQSGRMGQNFFEY